jgi:lysophospholipase L1-like esterase
VSVVVGMNDVMATNFDPESYRSDLLSIVRPLKETGTTVLLGTLPRDLPLLRIMPRRKAQSARRRLSDVSDVVLQVAVEHGAVYIDAPEGWRYTMVECSLDGCHPNARGHAHIAELALEALANRAEVSVPPFEYFDCGWVSTSLRHTRWIVSQGLLRPRSVLQGLKG